MVFQHDIEKSIKFWKIFQNSNQENNCPENNFEKLNFFRTLILFVSKYEPTHKKTPSMFFMMNFAIADLVMLMFRTISVRVIQLYTKKTNFPTKK